jgi:hypothetical protein
VAKIWTITAKLNRFLFPYMGPAQVGPYDDEHVTVKPCPLCGAPMAEHEIERRDGRPTQLHCPATRAA